MLAVIVNRTSDIGRVLVLNEMVLVLGVSRRAHELSRLTSPDVGHKTVRLLEKAVEAYPGWSVLVRKLFLELQKWR